MPDIAVAPIIVPDGTAAAPSITFRYRGNMGAYRTGNSFGIASRGAAVALFTGVASGVNYITFTNAAANGDPAIAAAGSDTNIDLLIDGKGSGTITLGGTSTGAITFGRNVGVTGTLTVTSAAAAALSVGPNGATNPVLSVVANGASAATGLAVTGAAAASGLGIAVISSGTDENMTINAKGSGTITINGTATGNIVLGRAATGVSLSVTGAVTAKSATAVPATAGAAAAGAALIANSNGMTMEWTTDAPTHTRPKGSVCWNINGSSTSTRGYVNTDGAGTWAAITTAS